MTTQTPQSFSTSGPGGEQTSTGTEGGASVRDRAAQVGGTAKDEAAGVAQEVKYQARDLAGEARTQIRQQVDVQRGRISDLLREVSEELEQMADRSDRNGLASDLARQGASRARDVRSYLDGGGDVLEDVRRFARRRPGTFLVGAVVAGVLAGRATRAAAAARRQQQSGGRSQGVATTYPGTYAGEYTAYGTTGATGATAYPQSAAYPAETTTGGYGAGTTGYATGTAAGTPSNSPTAGYGAAPATAPYGTAAGEGATTTGATQYQDAGYEEDPNAPAYDPTTGYVTGNPSGAQPGYAAPAETLPPDREER